MVENNTMKHSRYIRQLIATLSILALAAPQDILADGSDTTITVDPQPLAQALQEFSEQSGLQIAYVATLAENVSSLGTHGTDSPGDALVELLAGTGLEHRFVNVDTVTIGAGVANEEEQHLGKSRPASNQVLMAQNETSAEQSDTIDQSSSSAGVRVLEEIIVVAQKREENVQDVGLALTALTEEGLRIRGITSPQDLVTFVPSLTIGARDDGQAQVTIRGIGGTTQGITGDPGVAIHVDGYYMQSTSHALRDFLDIERIEVLRGPQGTLYGRNSNGGSINIITKRPTDVVEIHSLVAVGNYDNRLLQAVVNVPLADKLNARFAISDERRDGYIENVSGLSQNKLDSSDYTSMRASIAFAPNNNLDILVSGYHYKDTGTRMFYRPADPFPTAPDFDGISNPYLVNGAQPNITAIDPWKVRVNAPFFSKDESKGAGITLDWTLGSALLRSLSSYNESQQSNSGDLDGSDVVDWEEFNDLSFKTFSQEFQLLSNTESELQWIVGLYYYQEDTTSAFDLPLGDLVIPGLASRFVQRDVLDTTSLAAFGQLNYFLTETWELVAGLRYSNDNKSIANASVFDFDETIYSPNIPAGSLPFLEVGSPLDDEWSQITYRAGVNYHIEENLLLYLTYGTGYKSGGFEGTAPFDPEFVDSFELGIKSEWWDRRIRLNANVFYADFRDQQIERRNFVTVAIVNADSASTSGVELEGQAIVTDALTFDLAFAYVDAKFKDFETIDAAFPELGLQNLEGNRLERSPKYQVHLGAQYQFNLGRGGDLWARLDTAWSSEQFYRPYNAAIDLQPSYFRSNARLLWQDTESRWSAELYVQNIENNSVRSNQLVYSPVLGNVTSSQFLSPRTYGLRITFAY